MEQIKLSVCGADIVFEPNQTAYNKLINEMAMDNKVAPANNYLMRIVTPETKEALVDVLKRPVQRCNWSVRLMIFTRQNWRLK